MENSETSTVRTVILPQICWSKMDEHTVCVRLDEADPAVQYRVVFNGSYETGPDSDGLFRLRNAVPGSRYEIVCKAEVSPGVWESCCPVVKLNFVPPPQKPPGPVQHICGGMPVRATKNIGRAILTKVIQYDDQ